MHLILMSPDFIQREVGNKTEQEGWGIARRDQTFQCQDTRQPSFFCFDKIAPSIPPLQSHTICETLARIIFCHICKDGGFKGFWICVLMTFLGLAKCKKKSALTKLQLDFWPWHPSNRPIVPTIQPGNGSTFNAMADCIGHFLQPVKQECLRGY